ncbi:MAG: DUF5309 family protein [Candidatus Paceibacterota bacterium]
MSTAYQFVTYNATTGLKEDVLDVISQISPEDTPILSRLNVKTCMGKYHEWLTDSLQSGTGTGYGVSEGASAAFGALAARSRYGNYTTIMRKVFSISGTMEAVAQYGIDSEYSYQLEKAMKELKIMQEQSVIWMTSAAGSESASGAQGVARTFTGLLACIATSNVRTGSANVCTLTESEFNALFQTMFSNGAVPDICYANGFNKRRISSFATSNTRYQEPGSEGRVRNFVSVYEGDFCTVEVALDRYAPTNSVIATKSDKFSIAYLNNRKPKVVPLAKLGDSQDAMIITEYTFEYLNTYAGGLLSAWATA